MTTISNSIETHRIVIYDDESNVLPFQKMNFYVGVSPSQCFCNRYVSDKIMMCELAHNVDIDIKCKNGISVKGKWPNISIVAGELKVGMVRSLEINDTDKEGEFAHLVLDMAIDLP